MGEWYMELVVNLEKIVIRMGEVFGWRTNGHVIWHSPSC